MPTFRWRADCAQCSGLCCVASAFYAIQGFGFDKPAGRACVNLQPDCRCSIHQELPARGFPACADFDCYGAGQRVTQDLFGGRSWRDSPQLAQEMFNAYARYRFAHELMALLELALWKVSAEDGAPLREQLSRIEGLCDSGAVLSCVVRLQELRSETLGLLRAAPLRRDGWT